MTDRERYWQLFTQTGKIRYYTMYKRSWETEEEDDVRDLGGRDPRD